MMPDDALDPAVNSSQAEEQDDQPCPWDCDGAFPDDAEEEDE